MRSYGSGSAILLLDYFILLNANIILCWIQIVNVFLGENEQPIFPIIIGRKPAPPSGGPASPDSSLDKENRAPPHQNNLNSFRSVHSSWPRDRDSIENHEPVPEPPEQFRIIACTWSWLSRYHMLRKKWGLRIRMHLIRIRIRIQHFRLNNDPDPIRIQGFRWTKMKKITAEKKKIY
jgi:hypothetical protein